MNSTELLLAIAIVSIAASIIVRDALRTRHARDQNANDMARIEAIQRFQLGIVPGETFYVLQEEPGTTKVKVRRIGVGGKTVREAIDSALLELTPPNRRAGDPKEGGSQP